MTDYTLYGNHDPCPACEMRREAVTESSVMPSALPGSTLCRDTPAHSLAPDRTCAWCGAGFSFGSKNRTLCSNRCKKAAYYARHKALIDAKQKAKNRTENGLMARARYRSSAHGAAQRRENERLRAAARALSILLMPTNQHYVE